MVVIGYDGGDTVVALMYCDYNDDHHDSANDDDHDDDHNHNDWSQS